jgi:signal transduction histidine kinase
VLVLYSTRRDAQLVVVGDREMPRILAAGLPEGLDYYSEFIDGSRFPHEGYQDAFRDFLRLKYAGHSFDLIVAMDEIPLQFVTRNRDVLFSGAPIVFFTHATPAALPSNSTGLIVTTEFTGSITLARTLQPDLRHVFVVSGATDDDRAFENAARAQLRTLDAPLDVRYLTGLPTKDLELVLGQLPRNSMVYYLLVDRDGTGKIIHPLEYLDRVTAASSAPVYSWVDSALDHGVVGGDVKAQVAQAQAVSKVALRVLRGEAAEAIPVAFPNLNAVEIDWRQLQRWGIDERRVPAGATVRFRMPSVWDRYSGYIISALTAFVAQTLLIAGLILQHRRRRKAEARVRDLGSRLLNAQEAERSRIARDLHDDVSQQLALLSINLELLTQADSAGVHRLADDALRTTQTIARAIHDLSHRLHPTKLLLIGLLPAVRGLQRELAQSGVDISFAYDDLPPTLPPDLTLCLYRVVQEALQNAVKHGAAGRISVSLIGCGDAVVLTVADNGAGFDVDRAWGKGLGLISMSERVEAVAGMFEIHSAPGEGTRVIITIPIDLAAETETSRELVPHAV